MKNKVIPGVCPMFTTQSDVEALFLENIPRDESGLFRGLETILLPNSEVQIRSIEDYIAMLDDSIYPKKGCFTLTQFLDLRLDEEPQQKNLKIEYLKDRLVSLTGMPYVWGSSYVLTQFEKFVFYETFKDFPKQVLENLMHLFSGLDCSGLLHFVTSGHTPRNTSELVNFGIGLDIDQLSFSEILKKIKPLDFLVWKGHVVIFLSSEKIIESRLGYGVYLSDAQERLNEVLQSKRPVNSYVEGGFVVRRCVDFL